MARPQTEGQYLASLVPSSVAGTALARRNVLRAFLLGGAALGVGGSLAACGGDDGGSGSSESPSGTVSFGSNESGTTFAEQREAMAADFLDSSGVTVEINAVDHNTFQENINTYLQGNADDVFSWFAGFRMRFFADSGLIGDVSDVWPIDGIADSFKEASTGNDGKPVLRPAELLPVGRLPPEVDLRGERLEPADHARRDGHADGRDEDREPRSRSRSATRTAGPRWARSTCSTCASTASTTTSR